MISDTTIDPISAGTNPAIVNPVTTIDANQKNSAFKIIPNIPSVSMFTGKVSNEMIGLIKVFTSPSTSATNNAVINELTLIPGTRYAVASTARVSPIHFKIILIINNRKHALYQDCSFFNNSLEVLLLGFAF